MAERLADDCASACLPAEAASGSVTLAGKFRWWWRPRGVVVLGSGGRGAALTASFCFIAQLGREPRSFTFRVFMSG